MLSKRLLSLLRFAKTPNRPSFSWRLVAEALAEEYGEHISLDALMFHLTAVYDEIKAEPRFQIGGQTNLCKLLLAPISGYHSIDMYGPQSVDQTYTVEQFYDAFCLHIVGLLANTNIGWCRDELWCDSLPVISNSVDERSFAPQK